MSSPGDADGLLVAARSALLDVLDALGVYRDSVVVIGAQAIYLRTVGSAVAVAEMTKDSDIVIDPRRLRDSPLVEDAMFRAGFSRDPKNQPGAWLNAAGVPVDLMVPEDLAGGGGKSARGARIPPHDKRTARRARGLEAAVVDNEWMVVGALSGKDNRRFDVRVAGLAALVVAKVHKIAERIEDSPGRLVDKDAHDLDRILVHEPTRSLATDFQRLLADDLAGQVTQDALGMLEDHFATGPESLGSVMAGRAEIGVGEPETVALQTSILAAELIEILEAQGGL
ncbi:MAG: hypothetical protein KDB26_03670 [Microthrixaceae bacterium]|nr:hypothetical protein [Microthrixaceae bacterium]